MIEFDKSKPVMITGATGYVAGRIVEKLLAEGLTVHASVRDPKNEEKVKHLKRIAKANPGVLKLYKSDLLNEGSYDEAMQGCQLVFHTASPFVRNVEDPQRDLVDPAKNGTRNVLESANRTDSVERIVITSSCAAIYGDAKDTLSMPNQELSEEVWNTTSTLDHQPYSFSKTEAEKLAWQLESEQTRWQLVTVNPSFVMGPGINPNGTSESFTVMKQIGNGDFKMGGPDFKVGFIDVRDLADAHFRAGTYPNSKGRYIISNENSSFLELAGYIKEQFPNYPIKLRKLPKWLIWLMAPSIGMTRKEVAKNISYPWKANNGKSIKELNMEYRPLKNTVVEFFKQLIDAGVIEKK